GRLRLPPGRVSAKATALPPTALEAIGADVSTEEAVAYNRSRVATATALTLYRSGYSLPMPDSQLDAAVHALGFPRSVPSPQTRAAIPAALAVLESDHTVTLIN
ncbi:hypothetical protein ACWCQK_39975, partial [Streptomyces sp. NPDC002306]